MLGWPTSSSTRSHPQAKKKKKKISRINQQQQRRHSSSCKSQREPHHLSPSLADNRRSQVVQLFLGMPINMVHGSLRFGFMYEVGVASGALCHAVVRTLTDAQPHRIACARGNALGQAPPLRSEHVTNEKSCPLHFSGHRLHPSSRGSFRWRVLHSR